MLYDLYEKWYPDDFEVADYEFVIKFSIIQNGDINDISEFSQGNANIRYCKI